MDELNCEQEEQNVGPRRKKYLENCEGDFSCGCLALAVYVVYSVVYLFVSPDRNIQQI